MANYAPWTIIGGLLLVIVVFVVLPLTIQWPYSFDSTIPAPNTVPEAQQPTPGLPPPIIACVPDNYPLTSESIRQIVAFHFANAETRQGQTLRDVIAVVRERSEELGENSRVYDIRFTYIPSGGAAAPVEDYVRMYFNFKREPCGWIITREGGPKSGRNAANANRDRL